MIPETPKEFDDKSHEDVVFNAFVNGKYFPANSAINFQQISAVKNQQFIMPHISRGVSPGSVIYSNGRSTS